MLGSFLKPAWRSRSAKKRMLAVKEMKVELPENQNIFLQLVSNDTDLEIQKAALRKLSDPQVLHRLGLSHENEEIQTLAAGLFNQLTGPKSPLSVDEFRALMVDMPEFSEQLALSCPHKEVRTDYLSSLSESRQIELLTSIEYSDTRKYIVEKIDAATALEQARKALKGRDKTAEKVVKAKLETLRAKQRRIEENNQFATGLLDKIAYLESHDWQPDFKARYQSCQQQWKKLPQPVESSIEERFQQLTTIIEKEISERATIEAASTKQIVLAESLEKQAHELSKLYEAELLQWNRENALLDILTKASLEWADTEKITRPHLNVADQYLTAHQALKSLAVYIETHSTETYSKQQIAEIENVVDTETEKASSSKELVSSIKQLNLHMTSIFWPKGYPELALFSDLIDRKTTLENTQYEVKKAAKDELDRLHKKISAIQGMASRGHIGRARREIETATELTNLYQGRDRQALDERLERVSEAVSKMGDWKDFAIEPKYKMLCEKMQALIGSKRTPDNLAKEIHSLQNQWKRLGYSDSSDNYWSGFKEAADKAYEPCAKFFAERKAQRQANLQSREPLITQLEAILAQTNWDEVQELDAPDYKHIEQEIRAISNNWRKIKEVEPSAGQKQWERFSAVRATIYGKMDGVYDVNIAAKMSLIGQVKTLLQAAVREELFTSLQQIQIRWKQVGITRRKEDQEAWSEFKALTDELYAKIRALRNEKKSEEEAQINAYKELISKIHSLSKSAKELSESDPVFDTLEKAYHSLPELPQSFSEKLVEGLAKDFQRAKDAYSNARDRILSKAKNKEWQERTFSKAPRCCKARWF